jgi:molecular chaperone GrpE
MNDSDIHDPPAPEATSGAGGQARAGMPDPADTSAGEDAAPKGGAPSEAAPPEGPEVELARLRDRLLRTAADFDNFRKRTRRDIADAERRVQEQLLSALLPTFDNLERASTHAGSAPDVKALAEGLEMVLRQFKDALAGLGIERISTQGKAFDPAEHEAVQHVQSDEVPPGAIVQELQAGYRWQGKLLRPALVVVSKAGPPPQ